MSYVTREDFLTLKNNLTGIPFGEFRSAADPNPYGKSGAESIREWPCMKDREIIHHEPPFIEKRATLELR